MGFQTELVDTNWQRKCVKNAGRDEKTRKRSKGDVSKTK